MSKASILVVDDDIELAVTISDLLRQAGYRVERASNGKEALQLHNLFRPNLVLLDLILSEMNSFDVCTRLRADRDRRNVAVILLAAASEDPSIVASFETHVDDCLTKPVDFNVLLSRIAAVLHRTNYASNSHDHATKTGKGSDRQGKHKYKLRGQISIDGITLDMNRASVTTDRGTTLLTPNELTLLYFFMRNCGQIFSTKELLELAWDLDPQSRTESLIRQYIKSLRRKIESLPENPRYIKHVCGHGYLFDNPTSLIVDEHSN